MALYTPRETFEACRPEPITRGEAQTWQAKGFLNIPPANPGVGGARRYSLAGAFEFALFKAMVGAEDINARHDHASAAIRARLDFALALKGLPAGDYAALNDAANLVDTEFDTATHTGRWPVFWFIAPTHDIAAPIMSNWSPVRQNERVGPGPDSAAEIVDPATVLHRQIGGASKCLVLELSRILRQVERRLVGREFSLHEPGSGWNPI